eukprot:6735-Eustigmatos_ZCMA.PRE.1
MPGGAGDTLSRLGRTPPAAQNMRSSCNITIELYGDRPEGGARTFGDSRQRSTQHWHIEASMC